MDGYFNKSNIIRKLLTTDEISEVGVSCGASGAYAVNIAHRVYRNNSKKAQEICKALIEAAKIKHQKNELELEL